ncbi:MAG: acyltransferase family protein [Acutalibacteraceae bacterium]|nr:acyltransferase family protein [Acutalibacteraceae bacterium]
MKKERTIYFDLLRIIATVFVIGIHVNSKGWYYSDVATIDWNIYNVFASIPRCAVAIFCMISGALFLDLDKKIEIKSLYRKNILRVCTAFLFWSSVYAVLTAFTESNWNIGDIINNIINGHYHMWFLFMIVGFYIMVPIIRKIVEDRNVAKYFIILSVIITFVILPFFSFFGFSKGTKILDNFYFDMLLGYTPYFIIGYYLHKYDVSKFMQRVIYVLGGLAFVFTTIATAVLSNIKGEPNTVLYELLTLNILFESLALFLMGKYIFSKIKFTPKSIKFINILSRDTFGIYLSHVLVIEILYKLGLRTDIITPLLSVPLITVLALVISGVFSHLLNSIPVIKKYIV